MHGITKKTVEDMKEKINEIKNKKYYPTLSNIINLKM